MVEPEPAVADTGSSVDVLVDGVLAGPTESTGGVPMGGEVIFGSAGRPPFPVGQPTVKSSRRRTGSTTVAVRAAESASTEGFT